MAAYSRSCGVSLTLRVARGAHAFQPLLGRGIAVEHLLKPDGHRCADAVALQSQINGLTADFAARDDPAQRAKVGTDRQKALTELDRVKKEIQQHTKALADLQEEARRAGVPPGWLR